MVVISTLRGALQKRPLLMNIATFVGLLTAADCTCQVIQHKSLTFKYDFPRTARMATMGVIYYGPVFYYYYRLLDRKFPGTNPRTVIIKMAIDQFIFTVPSVACFYIGMSFLERKSWQENKKELKKKWLPTYVALNFAVVPPIYRVAYVASACYVWMAILSYLKNQPTLPAILQYIENLQSGDY